MWGGAPSGASVRNDLWTFDFPTHTWTEIQPNGGRFVQPPAALGMKAVVVDTHYMYMYGGVSGSTFRDSLWVLDMQQQMWREVNSAGTLALYRNYMGFDPVTKNVVMFGGFTAINSGNSNVMFRYNPPQKPIGVVTNISSLIVTVQTSGIVSNINWSLVSGLDVFVEPSGNLTQIPSQPYTNSVGIAVTSNMILLK